MITKKQVVRAIALLVLASVNACGDDGPPTLPDPPRPTMIVIEPASATLTYISETTSFTATVRDQYGTPMTATVTWSGSDESVFTVDGNGQITAAGNGSGTLQASFSGLSATATVNVEQRAAAIKIVSGDEQEALRGTKLPEPVVVRLEDRGGYGVAGQEITFAPGAESGSVSVESVSSDENGEGSTEWTLGNKFGAQTLVISAPAGIHDRARATATSDTLLPDLIIDTVSLSRDDPTDLETLDITATIANKGDAASPDTFQVQLILDGIVQETVNVPQLESGSETTLKFTAGPFETGTRRLTVVIDPDGRIDESAKENNTRTKSLTVAHQEVITVGHRSNISATLDDVLLFRIDVESGSKEALNVEISGGQGDPDLFVNYGSRPDHHYKSSCISGAQPGDPELCQFRPTRPGSYHVAVHAYSTFGPVELSITVGGREVETDYDIDLVFLESGTAEQEQAIREAAERWESVIVQGVKDHDASVNPIDLEHCGVPATINDVIDDVRMYVRIDSIDGPGKILASAGPCAVRAVTFEGYPAIARAVIVGDIIFDEDDLRDWASETVVSVATHEMAHVLGFGSLWNAFELLENPSVGSAQRRPDTHFTGPLARRAFERAGGRNYRDGAIVPVENNGKQGSADSHWRESVFEHELLTPYASRGFQPLSEITIESMADLGYNVDPTIADQYRIPSAGAAGMAADPESVIDLSDDIADYPIVFIDQKGRRVHVVRLRQ